MKQRMYMLVREIPHPTAKGQKTKVFFIGWVPADKGLTPMWGPPHENGVRNAVMFPNQSLVQQVIDDLPAAFKLGMRVVDAVIQEV